jgi:hypothetical protein
MSLDLDDLAMRQALLKAYDASCHAHVADIAVSASGGDWATEAGTTPDGPGLSAAAESFKQDHPHVISAPYDEKTSVHLNPPSRSCSDSCFVWGGGAATCGRRGQDCMEDTHFCYHGLEIFGNGSPVSMFGVFDGHGGPGAATHCSRVLPFEVLRTS